MGTLDWVILIAEVIIGLLLCFAGNKLKNKLMAIVWFVVGYLLLKEILPVIVPTIDFKFLLVGSVLGGLIFAFFSFELTSLSEYIIGFAAGFFVATTFLGFTLVGIVVGIVAGLICAGIAWKFAKYIIIIATAYIGASLVAPLIPQLISNLPIGAEYLALILFVFGAIVQFLTCGKKE